MLTPKASPSPTLSLWLAKSGFGDFLTVGATDDRPQPKQAGHFAFGAVETGLPIMIPDGLLLSILQGRNVMEFQNVAPLVRTFVAPLDRDRAGIVNFSGIVMVWYGVNYVLGAGLHSYGFGVGGEGYVIAFLALEAACASFAVGRKKVP